MDEECYTRPRPRPRPRPLPGLAPRPRPYPWPPRPRAACRPACPRPPPLSAPRPAPATCALGEPAAPSACNELAMCISIVLNGSAWKAGCAITAAKRCVSAWITLSRARALSGPLLPPPAGARLAPTSWSESASVPTLPSAPAPTSFFRFVFAAFFTPSAPRGALAAASACGRRGRGGGKGAMVRGDCDGTRAYAVYAHARAHARGLATAPHSAGGLFASLWMSCLASPSRRRRHRSRDHVELWNAEAAPRAFTAFPSFPKGLGGSPDLARRSHIKISPDLKSRAAAGRWSKKSAAMRAGAQENARSLVSRHPTPGFTGVPQSPVRGATRTATRASPLASARTAWGRRSLRRWARRSARS